MIYCEYDSIKFDEIKSKYNTLDLSCCVINNIMEYQGFGKNFLAYMIYELSDIYDCLVSEKYFLRLTDVQQSILISICYIISYKAFKRLNFINESLQTLNFKTFSYHIRESTINSIISQDMLENILKFFKEYERRNEGVGTGI